MTDELGTPVAFHVMTKPRGAICNLDCDYCYYLAKERLYPDGTFRMDSKLLEDYVRQYIEAQAVPEVTFAWQGGEPTLMGLDFFKLIIELQQKHRRTDMRIVNTLQTNGTLLDEEWCRFFRAHDFLIGISLDGPRDIHDAYRLDKGGNGSFDRVMRGVGLLKDHGVQFNVLTTVHAANADCPLVVYHFLRDEVGAKYIQFIPIVERDNAAGYQAGDGVSNRSVTGARYGAFLNSIFDDWLRHDVGNVFVQMFDVALGAWLNAPPSLCVFAETCGSCLALEHNGDLYSCDHFVEPRHRLGNIQHIPLADMATSEPQRRFGLNKRDTLPKCCRECDVRFACNGGCPKDRVLLSPDGEPGLNYLCAGYKSFFHHVDGAMRFMASELMSGRTAAGVMACVRRREEEIVRDYARVGRNEPCPCGSGRKSKRCHAGKAPTALPLEEIFATHNKAGHLLIGGTSHRE